VTGGAVQVLVARLGRVLRLPGVGLRLVDVPHKVVHHAAQLGHVVRDRSRLLLALPRCPSLVGDLRRHASLGPVQQSPLRFVGRRGGRAGAARSAGSRVTRLLMLQNASTGRARAQDLTGFQASAQ